MPSVIVDGREIELRPGEKLNGIQAAARAGVEIPHYCWHPGLSVVASCRMCLVEAGTKNPQTGQVVMQPKLVPACQTPATDGSVFITNSDKVQHARAFVEEALLIDHPIDCPICDKAGECRLQDYHFAHGQSERRADIRPFTSRRREMGDTVTLFVDRCVMCTRCVRFTREITGTSELLVIDRGSHDEIDVFPGFPLDNKLAGNVVDLCPVGALGDKDFLYSQRVWFMEPHAGVCAGCATGCSIWIDENQDQAYRLRPRENPHVNQWWMCDDGRYGFHDIHREDRQVGARRRDGQETTLLEWSQVVRELPNRLGGIGRLAAVLSPQLTVEETYLLVKFVLSLDPQAFLAVGPVLSEGADETFRNGFTIRAEKAPNRRGVEEVVKHFRDAAATWDDFLAEVDAGRIAAAWLTAGYHRPWHDEATAARLGALKALVVQDMFASPLWDSSTYRLPGASFAEKDGSYVNHADRLQSFRWAIRPPIGARTEGSVYWELLAGDGMYTARRVLDEVAREIPYFAAAADPVPDVGVDLKAPRPAVAATT